MQTTYNLSKKNDKPHKFFDKVLDNNLDKMSRFLTKVYKDIEDATLPGVSPIGSKEHEIWLETGSSSTVRWNQYNVFQFYTEEIHNVFASLRELVIEACEYYDIDFEKEKFYVQGWFNINDRNVGKLDWHDHGGPYAPFFHGYYCVKAEPSTTYYKIDNDDNKVFENINKDNRMIVSEMGHPHAMGDWDWDGPRITLAYDIVPLRFVKNFDEEQHWVPLV
jgi:hypothetical protein